MMKKLMLLAAGAAGYVLGTRAGRERYEQIKASAVKLKNNPTVQQKAHDAKAAAQDKMGSNGSDPSQPATTSTGYPQT
jgi:hypothetical protein